MCNKIKFDLSKGKLPQIPNKNGVIGAMIKYEKEINFSGATDYFEIDALILAFDLQEVIGKLHETLFGERMVHKIFDRKTDGLLYDFAREMKKIYNNVEGAASDKFEIEIIIIPSQLDIASTIYSYLRAANTFNFTHETLPIKYKINHSIEELSKYIPVRSWIYEQAKNKDFLPANTYIESVRTLMRNKICTDKLRGVMYFRIGDEEEVVKKSTVKGTQLWYYKDDKKLKAHIYDAKLLKEGEEYDTGDVY